MFQIVQEYTTEENAGREKWIQILVYWTASTVLRVEVTQGKLWFDVEETNGASGFCDCDEVKGKAVIEGRKETIAK
ncbi:hypothetical protein AAG906_031333 [Vitis piasezkii]